jgi:GT2 family glycosyltransferase
MKWLERGLQFDYPSIEGTEASWAHLYGANCSVKVELLATLGGYDEERLPYGYEDIDLGYRASRQGLRVLYNSRAVVQHLRHDMTLEFWKKRIRRAAAAERRFIGQHPELSPHLYRMFNEALSFPPARGRGARLARFVPRRLPVLGNRVWGAADLYWWQQLAPDFLDAWEAAEEEAGTAPDLSEREDLAASQQGNGG